MAAVYRSLHGYVSRIPYLTRQASPSVQAVIVRTIETHAPLSPVAVARSSSLSSLSENQIPTVSLWHDLSRTLCLEQARPASVSRWWRVVLLPHTHPSRTIVKAQDSLNSRFCSPFKTTTSLYEVRSFPGTPRYSISTTPSLS